MPKDQSRESIDRSVERITRDVKDLEEKIDKDLKDIGKRLDEREEKRK